MILNIFIQKDKNFIKIGYLEYKGKKEFIYHNIKDNHYERLGLVDKENLYYFFDALLPEETERKYYAQKANVSIDDTWNLLQKYGLESIGYFILSDKENLVLKNNNEQPSILSKERLLEQINHEKLDFIINNRMSVAGAQNKILLNYNEENKTYFIPNYLEATTHILKPEVKSNTLYPLATINEYYCMRLAKKIGLNIPNIYLDFINEPVYLIERFDRYKKDNIIYRLPVKDATQVLNIGKENKYYDASIDNLLLFLENVDLLKITAKEQLAKWLIYNFIIGNCDNHLKNISLIYSQDSYDCQLAPYYDLLSTAIYNSPLYNNSMSLDIKAWQQSQLTIALNEKIFISDIKYNDLIETVKKIGFRESKAMRIVDEIILNISSNYKILAKEIIDELPNEYKLHGSRLINGINHIIIASNIKQLFDSKPKVIKDRKIKR